MALIVVLPYDPAWPALFEKEKLRLENRLRACVREWHHIGSTSVPGLCAKPIIDVVGEAVSLEAVDECVPLFSALGYEGLGEFGIPQRRLFIREENGVRLNHLHIFPAGHAEVVRHLRFRDHLRENPEDAKAYGEIKSRLAALHPGDKEAYVAGKSPFIKALDRKIAEKYL